MTRASWLVSITLAAGSAVLCESTGIAWQQPPVPDRWVTAWGTSQNGLGTEAVTNTTCG